MRPKRKSKHKPKHKAGLSFKWLFLLIIGIVFVFVLDFLYVKISKGDFGGSERSHTEVLGVLPPLPPPSYKREAPPPNTADGYEKDRGTSFFLPKRITLSHNDGSRDEKSLGTNYATFALLFRH